jgi:hypothetical protein
MYKNNNTGQWLKEKSDIEQDSRNSNSTAGESKSVQHNSDLRMDNKAYDKSRIKSVRNVMSFMKSMKTSYDGNNHEVRFRVRNQTLSYCFWWFLTSLAASCSYWTSFTGNTLLVLIRLMWASISPMHHVFLWLMHAQYFSSN